MDEHNKSLYDLYKKIRKGEATVGEKIEFNLQASLSSFSESAIIKYYDRLYENDPDNIGA